MTPAHVTQILRTLLDGYDMVVVDAGSTLDERALAIFEAAEQVILPITPGDRARSRRCTRCSSTSARPARSG